MEKHSSLILNISYIGNHLSVPQLKTAQLQLISVLIMISIFTAQFLFYEQQAKFKPYIKGVATKKQENERTV